MLMIISAEDVIFACFFFNLRSGKGHIYLVLGPKNWASCKQNIHSAIQKDFVLI